MKHDLVICGGTLATASETFKADIGIRDGRIVTLGEGLTGEDVIDATGKLVLPGGIEAHCHIAQESGMGMMSASLFLLHARVARRDHSIHSVQPRVANGAQALYNGSVWLEGCYCGLRQALGRRARPHPPGFGAASCCRQPRRCVQHLQEGGRRRRPGPPIQCRQQLGMQRFGARAAAHHLELCDAGHRSRVCTVGTGARG